MTLCPFREGACLGGRLLFTTAVINGVLAPPLILIVVMLTSDRTVMGDAVNPAPQVSLAGGRSS